MRVLLQRVTAGAVRVDSSIVGQIGCGLVLLVGVGRGDAERHAQWLAEKVSRLRVFPDEQGGFSQSLIDVAAAALVVSQFTLYADAKKGRRPSFAEAAAPEHASGVFDCFVAALRAQGVADVQTGTFGAMMHVEIHNDGPVTLWLDTDTLGVP